MSRGFKIAFTLEVYTVILMLLMIAKRAKNNQNIL